MSLFTHAEKFVTDTHPLVWHLARHSNLSKEAHRRFVMADQGEAVIYLSTMTIAEILYLTEKNKIPEGLWRSFSQLMNQRLNDSYQVIDFTANLAFSLDQVPRESVPELPDRVIAATALTLQLPLITKDGRLQQWEGIQTIW